MKEEKETARTINAGAFTVRDEKLDAKACKMTIKEFGSAVIEGLAEGIVIYDRALRYLAWNPFMEQLTGLSVNQVLGLYAPSLFPHMTACGLDKLIKRALKGETTHSPDFSYESPTKGTLTWLSAVYAPYRNSDGEIIGVISLLRDVSERKRTEQALKESEERNRYLSDLAFEGIVVHQDFNVVEANATFARLVGYESPDEIVGRNVLSWVHPLFVDQVKGEVRDGYEGTYSVYLQRKDETVFPAELNVRKVFYKGRDARVVAVRDITDKKWAEEALRMAEARYRHLFENAMMGIFQSTVKGKLMDANQALASILGFSSPEDLISSVKDMGRQLYVEPEQRKHLIRLLEKQGSVQGLEINFYRKDKSIIWVSMNIRMVRNSQGNVLYLQGIVEDITERKSAEDALIKEKERFRALVEESPFGVSMIGSDGRYKYINQKFSEIFGYTLDDIPNGREWFRRAYPNPDYRCRVIASWTQYVMNRRYEKYPLLTYEVTCKDGTEKSIQFRPVAMGTGDFLMIYEDFTERRRLEEQLRQSEKLEAIGTLAGGIAHDFNNLLMGIQGYTSILQLSLDSNHPDYEKLDKIQALAQSGSDLTRQLLGFARGGKYEVRPTDLNDILTATSNMFGRTRKEIAIHRDFQESLWTVEVDRSQIEQVLLNLYVNAGQAMPGGGQLYLGTENVVVHENSVGLSQMQPGNYVCITVKDTGVGMDERTRQRVFEPFFTTREMRRGTGLGLASAYGIIQGHGGWIDVDSEEGSGTTFRVYLPASGKEIEAVQKPADEVAKGDETVLLVDDEDINIDVVREILEILGYGVIVAKGGQEAVDIFREKGALIDLVLLDMIMPGMGGGDTFDALRDIDPDVKVILSSGYSLHGEASRIMERGCTAFIQKPYRIQDLSEKLREVLDKNLSPFFSVSTDS